MNEVSNQFLASIVEAVKSNKLVLPVLPEVAIKVRKAVDSGEKAAADIAKIVATDPAISTRLLQVSNSPLYRGTNTIDSVQSAVARLGNNTVRTLVTTLVTQQLFYTQVPELKKLMERMWLHSTEVAAISHILASKYTKINAEEALLAGLLHDIGSVPLITEAESHKEVIDNLPLLEDAINRLHTTVGKMLLETWKFPDNLIKAVKDHEKFDREVPEADMVDVVMIANLHSYIGTKHPLASTNLANIPALARLGLTPEDSMEALKEAKEEAQEMQSLLLA